MMLYPIFINIENKLAVVIGGGQVAYRKANDLLNAGANVRIVSPDIHSSIEDLGRENETSVEIVLREYRAGDLDGATLAFAATNDPDTNNMVFKEAEKKGLFINSVDDPPNCSFYVPSLVRRGDLILAVSSSGASPAMSAKLRRIFEKDIPHNIEDILKSLREARLALLEFKDINSSERGNILKKVVNDNDLLNELVKFNNNGKIKEFLKTLF